MRPHQLPEEITKLTRDQREKLDLWLDDPDKTFPQVRDEFLATFGVPITEGKLKPYNQTRELADELSTAPEVALDADDLINIFNGKPVQFSPAGILLIQKRAFELAAEKTTSVSKLTGLLRIFAYEKQVELKERHAVVAEKNQETRQREADTRARLAALREVEVAHRMTRKQYEPNSKGASNKPDAKPTDGERVMSPAEVVLRACGTPGLFSRRVLPGERITDAIRRLYQILQDGQPLPPPIELKVSDASAAKTSAPNEPQLPLKGEKEILAQNEFSPVTAVCPLS